jgi:pyrrolysine biosynthesis protein PylD
MTRLTAERIRPVCANIAGQDRRLEEICGAPLREIAILAAAGPNARLPSRAIGAATVAVVPITAGGGIIPGFAEACRDIAEHVGFPAFVTRHSDVAGLGEAADRRAEVLLLADDGEFLAVNLKSGTVARNGECTGWGFATLLHRMSGGVGNREVLVLGLGPVGRSGASRLLDLGATVVLYDVVAEKAQNFLRGNPGIESGRIRIERDLLDALRRIPLVFDATPVAGIIEERAVTADSCICCPGVPPGPTPEAVRRLGSRFYHDPLQLGVATMLMRVVAHRILKEDCDAE